MVSLGHNELNRQLNELCRPLLLCPKSQIVKRTELDDHLEEITENQIVEHLFCTISIATNDRTHGIFSTVLIVKREGHQSSQNGHKSLIFCIIWHIKKLVALNQLPLARV